MKHGRMQCKRTTHAHVCMRAIHQCHVIIASQPGRFIWAFAVAKMSPPLVVAFRAPGSLGVVSMLEFCNASKNERNEFHHIEIQFPWLSDDFPAKNCFFSLQEKNWKKNLGHQSSKQKHGKKDCEKIIVPKFFWTPDSKNWPSCIIFPEGHCG